MHVYIDKYISSCTSADERDKEVVACTRVAGTAIEVIPHAVHRRLFDGQTFIKEDGSILLERCLFHELNLWFTISLISLSSCPVKLIRKHIIKF